MTNPRRLTELDGLRALAIGSVLAFHCLRFAVSRHSAADYASRLSLAGWGGVDVFFVLSGFLVGGILIDGRGQSGLIRRFLIRRFMRIVPLYAVVVTSFYLLRALLDAGWLFGGAAPWWSYATLTQNFATPIIGHDAVFLGPTWSLAVEVQIYVLLAAVLPRVPARAMLPLASVGIATAEACRLAASLLGHGLFGYFILPARIDAACLGIIAALVVRSDTAMSAARGHTTIIWLGTAVLIVAAVAMGAAGQGAGSPGANLFTHLALGLAGAGAIVALIARPEGWPSAALRSRALVVLGSISYGIYLLHVPTIGIARVLFGAPGFVINDVGGAIATILGVIATFALAWASWRWLEAPLNRWAHRVTADVRPASVDPHAGRVVTPVA